jgi:soluble lytic murein transglycosylase
MAYIQQDYSYMGGVDPQTEEELRQREEERLRLEQEQRLQQLQQQSFTPSSLQPVSPDMFQMPQTSEGVQVASMQPTPGMMPQPVQPSNTYQNMLQAESNNQNYTPQGTPLTSPKGAMFAAQVMPSTAQNPGYGIQPAASQTPEEYNRVGQEYYNKMLQKYNGDERLAAAAYNAGPGRVDKAVEIASTQGGDALQYLPKETQNYVQKVGLTQPKSVAPAATQQQMAQTQPTMQQPETMAPGPAVNPNNMALDRYNTLQEDPKLLLNFANDKREPEWLRERARNRATDLLVNNREEQKAQKEIQQMDGNQLAQRLREKTTGGSWTKAIIYGLLGMEQSQAAEAAKLGIGKETIMQGADGQAYMVKVARNGTPLEGYNATTGDKLTANELIAVTAESNPANLKGANAGGQLYRDPVTNQSLTKVDTLRGPVYYDKNSKRVTPKGEPVPLTAGSDITTQLQLAQMKRQQQFVGQTADERMRAFRETNSERALAGLTPLTPEQMGLNANGELMGQKQPTVPPLQQPPGINPAQPAAPAGAQATPQAQPAQRGAQQAPMAPAQPVAPVAPTQPITAKTPAEMQAERLAKAEAAKLIVKPAAEQIAISADTQNTLNSIKKVEGILESGKHNIGSTASAVVGRGPIAQAIGEQFETTDAKNTKLVLDTVNKLAADGLKVLGSNPSTADLQFWTENKPNGSTDPEVMKAWVKSRSEDIKRRLGYAEKQVGAGGTAGAAPQVFPEKTINGVTYIYDGKGWKQK